MGISEVSTAAKLPESTDDWFAGTEQHKGSWWTDWQAWLTEIDGEQTEPRDPAKGKLKAIEDAPGSFVKSRADAKEVAA